MKNILIKFILRFLPTAVLVLTPVLVLAQASPFNPIGHTSLFCFLRDILTIVLRIGILVAAMFIVYSGYLFVTAGGDVSKLKDAKVAFFGAIIGTAVLLGSWVITAAIVGTVNALRSADSKIDLDSCDSLPGETAGPSDSFPGEPANPPPPVYNNNYNYDPNCVNGGSNTNNCNNWSATSQ